MADLEPVDPVRDALSDLAARPGRPAGAVLDDLRPAMGRARLSRRLHVASMTAVAAGLVAVAGLTLRTPDAPQPVRVADETPGIEEILPGPVPDPTETAGLPSSTTVTSSTAPPLTTVPPIEATVAPSATTLVPSLAPAADPDPTPSSPGPAPQPTSVPAPTTPPSGPATSQPAAPPPPASPSTVVIEVPGAGIITVEHTPTTITDIAVTTTGGSTYEIEDRTVHEAKVEFAGEDQGRGGDPPRGRRGHVPDRRRRIGQLISRGPGR